MQNLQFRRPLEIKLSRDHFERTLHKLTTAHASRDRVHCDPLAVRPPARLQMVRFGLHLTEIEVTLEFAALTQILAITEARMPTNP